MPDFTAVALKPTLDPRSDSTQICCPGSYFLGFAFTRPACRHLHHISAWSFFPLSLRRRQMGEEKWVLLGLKLFHNWAANAADPFSFTSCGSIHVSFVLDPLPLPGILGPCFSELTFFHCFFQHPLKAELRVMAEGRELILDLEKNE